jgi:signal transduction histidine kinase
MQEVRCSVSTLRADAQEQRCLQGSIEALIEDFRQGTGIYITRDIHLQTAIPSEASRTLYRIVQEALTNISKYAQATVVEIQLRTVGDAIQLTVTDNGKGFEPTQVTDGFGLQGMHERVAALDGRLQIKSADEKGCQIQVELPLRKPKF